MQEEFPIFLFLDINKYLTVTDALSMRLVSKYFERAFWYNNWKGGIDIDRIGLKHHGWDLSRDHLYRRLMIMKISSMPYFKMVPILTEVSYIRSLKRFGTSDIPYNVKFMKLTECYPVYKLGLDSILSHYNPRIDYWKNNEYIRLCCEITTIPKSEKFIWSRDIALYYQ